MPVMTTGEVEAFLAEPGHLVRIATVDDDGVPACSPVWFVHEDERIYVTPRARSAWWAHLLARPVACMVIDEEAAPYRKVTLRGPVEVVHGLGEDDAWRDRYRRITERYVPPEVADAYLTATWDEPRALVAMRLSAPARATTWRMPVAGEDPSGIWAPRYYHR